MRNLSKYFAWIVGTIDAVYGFWTFRGAIGKGVFVFLMVGFSLFLIWSDQNQFADMGKDVKSPLFLFGYKGVNQDLNSQARKIFGWGFLIALIPGGIWLAGRAGL